jgi:omega-hydroxy-beta-dihydromenaquinone-9 sulfotransferase
VLKSPGHTCRIKMLLDVFPDAKFVHIHRNPYAVFQSTQHTLRKVLPWWAMQRSTILEDLDERTIRQFKQVYEVFFEEKELIPQDRFHDVSFENLEADPMGQVRRIYEALALPEFQDVEPTLRRYVESLTGYKKNTFREIPAELKMRIAGEWRRCFEEWHYPT